MLKVPYVPYVPEAHGLYFATSAITHASYVVGGGLVGYFLQRNPLERFLFSFDICIVYQYYFQHKKGS